MKLGTKSLLFGTHQVFWHPITVWLAWRCLYGKCPTFWETVAIVVHDWGYWGKEDMDGPDGVDHPELGARIMAWLQPRNTKLPDLVRCHSRTYSRRIGKTESRLCWADKACIDWDPRWWYLFRARLSGELAEYRLNAHKSCHVFDWEADRVWYDWLRERQVSIAFDAAIKFDA